QADPPDPSKIPVQDAVGVTVVLLTCSYRGREFIRVGYYVNNEYADPDLKENPPSSPHFDRLQRNILATNPRVTRFKIDWDDNPGVDSVATDASSSAAVTEDNSIGPLLRAPLLLNDSSHSMEVA
ncbi:unnamed protein product, partial [Ixodes pacificus]